MQLLRKITPAMIGAKPPGKDAQGVQQPGADLTIVGIANSVEQDESDLGPFIRIFGGFQATNNVTKKVYRSAQAILPGIAQDMLAGAVRTLGPDGKGVRFAIRLWHEEVSREESPVGYVWRCETLMDMPILTEVANMARDLAALPAPDGQKGG